MAQESYSQARQYFCEELAVFEKFKDYKSVEKVISFLGKIYQITQDDSLLAAVARYINATPAEVQQLFAAASA